MQVFHTVNYIECVFIGGWLQQEKKWKRGENVSKHTHKYQ